MNYSAKSIQQFLECLGSSQATPGGGAAAALTAATAVALLEMVLRINSSRRKEVKAQIKVVVRLKKQLLRLLSKDAANFQKNLKVFSLPKGSPLYQKALKTCSEAPIAMCQVIEKAAGIAQTQKKLTSRWLYSDLAESAILLDAALESARLNAEINLRGFLNQKQADKLRKSIQIQSVKIKKIKNELVGQF